MSEGTAKVIPFPGITRLDTNPANVLRFAADESFDRVIVIGILANGEEYVASSVADGGVFLYDIERAKHRLMKMADKMIGDE